jgi:hypothetical protein
VHPDGTVDGSAFLLRERSPGGREEYLSVNWLEWFPHRDRPDQLQVLRAVLAAKLHIKASYRLGVLNVGKMREHVRTTATDRPNVRVLHEPEPGDESHAGIHGVQPAEEVIGELIAETVEEVVPARA